jgi:GNAT superfamily N-acetyltransferase
MNAYSREQVAVRQATAEEANDVAEVLLQARHANEPDIPNLAHSDNEVRGWVAAVLMDQCEVWVAVVDSEIVGTMALRDDWIEQLYVAPGHMSRGIGARLIATAQDRSPAGLQLWTFETNRRAQRFYERHGFVAVERSDGSRNEEGAPDVRYRWAYSSKKSARQDE